VGELEIGERWAWGDAIAGAHLERTQVDRERRGKKIARWWERRRVFRAVFASRK